jgi:tetratricopeptide (TPR) repeat protein
MKKIIILSIFATAALLLSSCIKETEPQGGTVTTEQIAEVPTAVLSYAAGLDGWRNNFNTFNYADAEDVPHWDFGYPSLMIQRDLMGQDIEYSPGNYGQYNTWYNVGIALGPDYLICQYPWRWYYRWASQANTIMSLVPEPESASKEYVWALGKAYFYRALAYFDLGRLYLSGSYANNPQGLTVPRVTNETVDVANNPRLPAEDLYPLILEDLDYAAQYLADAPAADKNTPTLAAVHGLYARVYLEIGNWGEAERYAKLAQAGFTPLTEAQWLDRTNGFNTPDNNNSWIFCTSVTADNDVVQTGIINWTSHMSAEADFGYTGAGAGVVVAIDRHLYDLIQATDFRKKSYVKPGATEAEVETNSPFIDWIISKPYLSLKFRPSKGNYENYEVAAASSVPLMRVEEMYLIEAEAAARQDAARGKQVLENFVKTYRDPAYVSVGSSTDLVVDEIWVQRRIELWGEGFATFDIKRLNKGITRSYTGTNHRTGFRYNTTTSPAWMNYCIVRTEFNNNFSINPDENNPAPVTPSDAPPAW